jgi:hypothetical protein
LHFIQYASEEILDYINKGGDVEEWYQNKLSKVHSDMESLHSYMEGEARRTGMKEEVELDEVKTYGSVSSKIKAASAKAFATGVKHGKSGAAKDKTHMASALLKTTYLNGYKQGSMKEEVSKTAEAPKMVRDRKTGEMYDPKKKFKELMVKPEVKAVMNRLAKEDVVTEVSQQTLQSYRKKAAKQKSDALDVADRPDTDDATWVKNMNIASKRKDGIVGANKRLGVTEGADADSIRDRIASKQRDLKAVTGNSPGDGRNRSLIRSQIFALKAELKASGVKKEEVELDEAMSPQQQMDFDRMMKGAMSRVAYNAKWKKPLKSDAKVIYGKNVKEEFELDEVNASKYSHIGANKNTTHFLKNATTGEVVSPHRGKEDAEGALVAAERDNKAGHSFKVVRAKHIKEEVQLVDFKKFVSK